MKGKDKTALPNDIAALQEQIKHKDNFIFELQKKNDILSEQLRLIQNYRFAKSSEKWTKDDKEQLRLFNEAEDIVIL